MNTYAELLSKYIENSKLSLGEISLKLASKNIKVDRSYISKLKNGNKPPASEELTRALAEITGGDVNKLIIAGQMERLKPILEELGEKGFEEFLNSVIGFMVSRQHFVDEMNRRRKIQCDKTNTPFTPLSSEEIQKGFQKASIEDKLNLSRFFAYSLDKENNISVYPLSTSFNKANYVYKELGFDKEPPEEDELKILKIALSTYRMGKKQNS